MPNVAMPISAIRLHFIAFLILFVGISTAVSQTNQNDKELAESAAISWVNGMSSEASDIYKNKTSLFFRQTVNPQQFSTNISIWRIQVGGSPTEVAVVGSTYFSRAPTGALGDFYYTRVKAGYPNGKLFIDVYLSKVGPAWKVDGFTFTPAP